MNRNCYLTRARHGTFAARLRSLRQQREWSQADLAHETGKAVNHIYHLESGNIEPNMESLRQFAQAFDMSISELLEGVL